MPTEKEIAKYIETGNFTLVLQHVKDTTKPARDIVDSSYRFLKVVYSFCYKNNKKNEKRPASEVDNVYELTTILCENISSTWKCNRLTFMQCLYHVNNYLVKHNPLHARRVSEYFFQLKSASWDAAWDLNESLVVANLVHDFISQLPDRCLEILSSTGDNSLASWLDFVFRLFELNDSKKLYKLFSVLDSIWVKVYRQCNDKLKECVVQCLAKVGRWLKSYRTLSDRNVETTDKDISSFFSLIERAVSILDVNDVSEILETCVDINFKILFSQYEEDVNILTDCFKFYVDIGKPNVVVDNFDKTFSRIMERTSKRSAALPIVAVLAIKFRSSILESSVLVESRVSNVIKLMLELMSCSQKESDTPSKKAKMIADLSHCALSIIVAPTVQKDFLISVFPQVTTIVKQFIKAIPDIDNNVNISIGVSAILNVVLAFKQVERFEEPTWLCRYVLLIFMKIDPNLLWEDYYYKSYVETWLRIIVVAYSKCNLGPEAQVMLIVFAAYQPKYTMSAMQAWAKLKSSKWQNKIADATVLDVLNVNGEDIEKHFPQIKLTDINLDLVLLGEIYGYTKLRELRGDPVLLVYKTAARTVKDHVILANILCCTVEAFSLTNDTAHFSKLDTSLNNMIKHLQKIEENGRECEHDSSVVLCTIGNLFYQKSRLEIQRVRQKSEAEVAQNEKWNAKKMIPIFRAGEKDDLDVTEVDLVGSSFKLSQKSDVLPSLTNALNYWKLCEKSIVPNIILEPTLSFMKGAGYLTRMYRYKPLETTCWNLLYKIASKLESRKYQVLAAAELLFSCESVDSSIISEMENIMQNPKRIDRKCYVYHLYRICYARNLLFCRKIDESRRALEKIDAQAVLPHFLVNAQLTIMRVVLDIGGPKDETPVYPIAKLFENILYLVKNNEWETFNEACVVQCLMIDVSTLLGTIYSDLHFVRRARLYTKTELAMVQRLALPVRVCEFMTLKCWVDLLTWNVTDSDLNAQEVENMLELGVLKTDVPSKSDPEMSQGSAIKCVPHFLSKKECGCNHCRSVNYPLLALNAIINRILILVGNGVRLEAQNVINVGLSVVEIVEQKNKSWNSLMTPFSSSVARFYYAVAKTNVLWEKYKEGIHYATLAFNMLQSEPVKNHGLIKSSTQLLQEIKFAQTYNEVQPIVPVSQRFALQLHNERVVTPEAQKYTDAKPWESSVHNRKTAPKGYLTHRKSLFNKNLSFCGPDTPENGILNEFDCVALKGLTPVSNRKVRTTNGKIQTDKKLEVPAITVSHTPEEPKVVGKKRFEAGDVESKFDDSHKLQVGMAALDLNGGDGVTPVAKRTGRKVPMVGSSRRIQTEKKTGLHRLNLFNAGSISSLTKMTSTTPAIKVFYDPEGLAHSTTAKKNKTKEVVAKRTTRLAALSRAVREDKFGTPTASKTVRTAKGKLTFDEGSDDELELVVAAPRRKQDSKRNGASKKIQEVEIDTASIAEAKSSEPLASESGGVIKTEPIVTDDSDDQESVIAPFRKVLNRRNDRSVPPKRIIHDETTFIEESSVVMKDVQKSGIKIALKTELVAGVQSNADDSEEQEPIVSPFRKILGAERKESSRRLIHDETTLIEQSIRIRQSKAKKKIVKQDILKPNSAASRQSNFDKDESDDEQEPIAAPFRKILDREGHERIRPSNRLIHDETTVIDQSFSVAQSEPGTSGLQTSSKHSDFDDQEQIAAPFRKILGGEGRERIRPFNRLIHGETFSIAQSEPSTSGVQTSSKQSDFDNRESVVAPFRKILRNDRIGSSKRLIHDDTTVVEQSVFEHSSDSPDLIESSIVQTTPPTSRRRGVALTPVSIEEQMSKLTLATKSSKKRGPPTTVPESSQTHKDVASGLSKPASSKTAKESSLLAKKATSRPLRSAIKRPN